ncbi:MAG: cytochrome c oxidase subunit II [Corallincola sp.]|nr:cytochrome c oxidase subunit II [Corallincola sp.]
MPLNMTRGVTAISREVYDLHMLIFYICCAVGLLVFAAMFWAIIRHRKSRGHQAAQFHESTKVELLWTAIPLLILVAMAVPATRTLMAMEDTSASELTVVATGSQWKWHYNYLDQGVAFTSRMATRPGEIANKIAKGDNYLLEVDYPLVLPVGRKVRLLTTSTDVIHSWWVPALAVKKDAIPHFINEVWTRIDEPGIYRGQCAELCGKDHAFMPVVVVAKPADEFDQWLASTRDAQAAEQQRQAELAAQQMTMAEAMAEGEAVYLTACAACHQPNGQGLPGAFPALKGGVITTGKVAEHIRIVRFGKPGTAMQAFDSQLTARQLAAVITYERNAWGNNTGDLVQVTDLQSVAAK